jgi:predicted O-linked N-acetylglucosamine transferase (SPINDLY family)
LAGYEELALKLAREEDVLHALKERLASGWHTQPLFDATGYSTRLETLLNSLSPPSAPRSFLNTT